jgi:hypothetical protein
MRKTGMDVKNIPIPQPMVACVLTANALYKAAFAAKQMLHAEEEQKLKDNRKREALIVVPASRFLLSFFSFIVVPAC